MSKTRKKKGAESLEAQARMHETLYGMDYDEATEYRRQALEMAKKYEVRPDEETIARDELQLFEKRLAEFKDGTRVMRGELPFYRVLKEIESGHSIDAKNEIESKNLRMLELLGYIKDCRITGNGRELLRSVKKSKTPVS